METLLFVCFIGCLIIFTTGLVGCASCINAVNKGADPLRVYWGDLFWWVTLTGGSFVVGWWFLLILQILNE